SMLGLGARNSSEWKCSLKARAAALYSLNAILGPGPSGVRDAILENVGPICLAVFRLNTSSNFVGCSTGKSAGFAPLRILSTYVAARPTRLSTARRKYLRCCGWPAHILYLWARACRANVTAREFSVSCCNEARICY